MRAHRRGPRRRRRRRSRRAARQPQLGRRPLIKYTLGRRARPVRRCRSSSSSPATSARCPATELSHDDVAARALRLVARPRAAADQGRPTSRSARSSTSCPRASTRPTHVLEEKAKAAVLLMRLDPEDLKVPKERDWGYDGHRRLLQDLHPRRLPGRPVRAADAPPALPVPPVDVRRDARTARSSSARPSGRCRSCRSPSTTRATWSPTRPSTKPSARASGSADEHHDTPKRGGLRTDDASRRPPTARSPGRRRRRRLRRRPHRRGQAGRATCCKKVFPDHWSFMLGEIALYSFIILPADRHLPDLLVRPERRPGRLRRLVRPAARASRCPRPTRSTLDISFDIRGGLLIRQIHHWAALMFVVAIIGAHVPGLLHRRVPQAARDQLGHRLRSCSLLAHASRASPATRCPTTCSPAPACASPRASCARSR